METGKMKNVGKLKVKKNETNDMFIIIHCLNFLWDDEQNEVNF